MPTFSKTDYLRYAAFLLGCTTLGVMIFMGLFGLPTFFTVFLTLIGTQLALKLLGRKVIGIDYWMTKEKKL